MSNKTWRLALLAAIPFAVLAALFSHPPIPQPLEYHLFADSRGCFGVPNFGDVASNLAFLIAGLLGLHQCLTARPEGARFAWLLFFAGAALVSLGSAYYHWEPNNRTLLWDRLPMTIGFMGAYVALVAEYADRRLEPLLILPAVAVGFASVIYWGLTDDLRLYFAVQGTVFASVLLLIAAFPHPPRQRAFLALGLGTYALAILFEQLDRQIYEIMAGVVSGHTIKHLLAACAVFVLVRMMHLRASRPDRAAEAAV